MGEGWQKVKLVISNVTRAKFVSICVGEREKRGTERIPERGRGSWEIPREKRQMLIQLLWPQ